MIVELLIKESKYPVDVKIIFKNGKISYISAYNGNNISTFRSFQEFSGDTLEESITKLNEALVHAIDEMMKY